ncbi:MAG TPA: phosphotransferase [Anaerolineales bacterium]|nr:phosphotransferase [Anaerolineales bacterium]
MSLGSKPLIVEFFGTPGAGKTTLMKAAREIFEKEGLRAYSVVEAARPFARRTLLGKIVNRFAPARLRNPLLWQVFYFTSLAYRLEFQREHRQLIEYVSESQKHRPAEAAIRERRTLHWFNQLVGRYAFLKAYAQPGEVLIFDDGYVHRTVHLHASIVETPDPARVRTYLDLIPQPDLVIIPCVPVEICEERILQRGIWEYFRDKSREELRQYLISSHRAVTEATDHIKKKEWNVIEVDNSTGSPDGARQELQKKMMNVFASHNWQPASLNGKTTVPWIPHLPRPSMVSEFVKSRTRSLDIEPKTVEMVVDRFGLKLIKPPANLPLSRRTHNLILHTSTGRKVVKRYRARLEIPSILYSHSILERLAELNIPGPRLNTSREGTNFVSLESGNCAVFDFVEGTNYSLSFVPSSHRRTLMHIAGQTLGRFHIALAGFMPEGWHHLGFVSYTGDWRRNMAWHATKVDEMKEKSRALKNEDEKKHASWLVENCQYILNELGQVDETLRNSSLTRLIIHGDYGLHNLLFQQDVVTPIDFESSRLEWRLSELVLALSRVRHRDGTYNFESIRTFLTGYQSTYPIREEEWRLLPLVWRFHKLRSSLINWNSYFESGGAVHKLISARDAVSQADWAMKNPEKLLRLNSAISI